LGARCGTGRSKDDCNGNDEKAAKKNHARNCSGSRPGCKFKLDRGRAAEIIRAN
jgi:hypothetical protein